MIMEPEAAISTILAASIGELESQDLQDQLSNDVIRSFGIENDNAQHFSIDDNLITLPLSPPEEILTNPSTYSREETIDCIQRGVAQYWEDDLAAQQMNAGTNMQNPPQEQNSSQEQSPPQEQSSLHAPSATPEVKPIPQAKARGVKRTRASGPESGAAKRPSRGKRQPATKEAKSEEPRGLRKLLSKPRKPELDQPCAFSPIDAARQQGFQASGRSAYGMGTPAWVPANRQPASHGNAAVIPGVQLPDCGPLQTQMSMDPRGFAFSGNANVYKPYRMPPRQQGTTTNMLPTPAPSPGHIPYPMPPQQQLANGMTMGSMGHHQPVGNGIPAMNVPPSFSVGHIQPRVYGNATMHQYNGPVVNTPSSSQYQPGARPWWT